MILILHYEVEQLEKGKRRHKITSIKQSTCVCTCVQPLRNSARKPVQPLASASMPSRVIWSHHDRFNVSNIRQPSLNTRIHCKMKINNRLKTCVIKTPQPQEVCGCYLRALREWLLMDTQEVRSSCLSLEQNLLRLRQVLSVILVQPLRFNTSMFLQF